MATIRDEKSGLGPEHREQVQGLPKDETVNNGEEEPTIHMRTWLALISMGVLQYTSLVALVGPPTVVSNFLSRLAPHSIFTMLICRLQLDNIGLAFADSERRYWIVNAATLVQAALGPFFSSISDVFQARKSVIFSLVTLAFVGAAIVPNSDSILRVIGGSIMIGCGLAAAPLSYAVPSEIVPRRWRSGRPFMKFVMPCTDSPQQLVKASSTCLEASGLSLVLWLVSSLSDPTATVNPDASLVGALTQDNPTGGWRKFYVSARLPHEGVRVADCIQWIQTGLWGFTAIGILIGYLPPKRSLHKSTAVSNLKRIDWIGSAMLTAGITLFVAGVSFQSVYGWSSGQVLGPLISGIVGFVAFGLYETYGTKHGIIPHELFETNYKTGWVLLNLAILFFIEGATFFSIVTFYPAM